MRLLLENSMSRKKNGTPQKRNFIGLVQHFGASELILEWQ